MSRAYLLALVMALLCVSGVMAGGGGEKRMPFRTMSMGKRSPFRSLSMGKRGLFYGVEPVSNEGTYKRSPFRTLSMGKRSAHDFDEDRDGY